MARSALKVTPLHGLGLVFVVTAGLAVGQSPPGAAARAAAPGDAVLASFASGRITVADFVSALANKLPWQRVRLATPEGRADFLMKLVRYDVLVAEAERRGYATHPAVQLAARKAAIDALLARELTVEPASIDAAAVAERYARDGAQYHRPALRRASEIVVATETEARALLAQLATSGRETFGALARERSLDARTRRQSGELGWFTRDGRGAEGSKLADLPDGVAAVSFALPRVPALVPRPLRVQGGFAVLLVTGEMKALDRPLAKVEGEIRDTLAAERSAARVDAFVAERTRALAVQTYPDLLSQVRLDPRASPDIPRGFPAGPDDPRAPARVVEPDAY